MLRVLLALGVCGLLSGQADAANILVVFPMPGKSHWFALKPLFLGLTEKGHNITLVTVFKENDLPDSWEVKVIPDHMSAQIELPNTIGMFSNSRKFGMYDALVNFGLDLCEKLVKEEVIHDLMNTNERKFDLFMMEFFNHNCLLPIAHRLNVPVIALSSFSGLPWTSDAVGNPSPMAYVPDTSLAYTDHMTFSQRLTNALVVAYARYLYYYNFIPKVDAMIRNEFKDPTMPSVAQLERSTSLVIVQSHVSFGYPRPHLPNVIETGGMHIRPPNKLPQDLQKFLDDAKDGIVYFSMGSLVRSSDFPEDTLKTFLSVFSKLKQVVLWKWDKEDVPGKPENVRLAKWLPQADLLAHKHVRAFISHGGLQSTLEATSRGVPLVGIPVGGDQPYNVARAAAAGYCVPLDLNNITERSLQWALSEVLDNPRYLENAKLRSRLFHDRPEKAVDTAVYWTEYVLRHGGARHLRSAALDLSWYQYLLLDVLAALVLAAAAVLAALGLAVRALYRLLTASSQAQKTKKSTKSE